MGPPKGLQAGSEEVAWQGLRRPAQQADSPVARQETQGHYITLTRPRGPAGEQSPGPQVRGGWAFGRQLGHLSGAGARARAMLGSSPGAWPAAAEVSAGPEQSV